MPGPIKAQLDAVMLIAIGVHPIADTVQAAGLFEPVEDLHTGGVPRGPDETRVDGRGRGMVPASKVSMIIMRPPQQGQGRGSARGIAQFHCAGVAVRRAARGNACTSCPIRMGTERCG